MSKYYSITIRIISIITLVAFVATQAGPGYAEKMGIVPHPKSQRSLSGTVPIFSHIRAKSIGENSEDTLKIAGELDPARKPPALATPTIAEGPAVKKSTDAT